MNNLKRYIILSRPNSCFVIGLLSLAVSVSGCKKNRDTTVYATDFLSYSVEHGSYTNLFKTEKRIVISLNDDVDSKKLNGFFQLSRGAVARLNGVVQKSSDIIDLSHPVTYTIEAPDGSTAKWLVSTQADTEDTGLGLKVTAKKSNDLQYDWYLAQDNTGTYSNSNGGATVAAMAAHWADPTLVYVNAVDQRIELDSLRIVRAKAANMAPPPPGGSFNVLDVTYDLTKYFIPWKMVSLPDRYASIKYYIDQGYIVILCMDLRQIPYDFYEMHHIGRFINTPIAGGHFIIVKGYKETDDANFWLEVYDPFSAKLYYSNGGFLKAKNRYYHSQSVEDATNKWWDYAIVVYKTGRILPTLEYEVKPSTVYNSSGY